MMNYPAAPRFGLLIACLASAVAPGAQIGEPAPALAVKEWVRGKPVELKAGTNLFVVEIWGSWSRGSRASITNLNAIQKRYGPRGLLVAAVSDEPVEKIKEYLRNEGTNVEFSVAVDDQQQTARNYMAPLRQFGIPYAFVVGTNGTLLWHGRPAGDLTRTLDQIFAGTFDLEQAGKDRIARRQLEQYLSMAQHGDKRTQAAGRRLLELRTNNVAQLCELAYQIAIHPQIPKRDIALAVEALDRAEKIATTNAFRVALTRVVLLFETGKREEALAQVNQAIAAAKDEKDKAEAEACLRFIEARLKAQAAARDRRLAATNVTHTAGTNNAPTPGATNQSEQATSPGSDTPQKPRP